MLHFGRGLVILLVTWVNKCLMITVKFNKNPVVGYSINKQTKNHQGVKVPSKFNSKHSKEKSLHLQPLPNELMNCMINENRHEAKEHFLLKG